MRPTEQQYHCRLCNFVCEHPHATTNLIDVTDNGDPVLADRCVPTEGSEYPGVTVYLPWDGTDHRHQLQLGGKGPRYVAELLAGALGTAALA